MGVFLISKLLLNYNDMKDIFSLKESAKLFDQNKKDLVNFTENYFGLLSGIVKDISSKLEKAKIDDPNINSILSILLYPSNAKIDDYIKALFDFSSIIENLGDNSVDELDNTLNKKFSINIYPRKSNNKLNIQLKKTATGWSIYNPIFEAWLETDKYCTNHFFSILNGSSINYPEDLSGYLKWLWEISTVYNLTEQEVSNEFDELSKWINLCNDYSPNTKLGGYK